MFLQKLLDPEDERRRRVRRARIVRRNRIKREVAQGLPVRNPRIPRAGDYALNLDNDADIEQWSETKSPFRPTFGGNLDDFGLQQQDLAPIRTQQAFTTLARRAPASKATAQSSSVLSGSPESISSSITPHIKARWQDVFQQVVFKRHEEILAKDPNRKWRQERFGLLLFAKGEYVRASEHLSIAINLGATSSLCWRRLAESYYRVWEDGGEWETLWACRAAYEQALTHVEVACSPLSLLTYARVLESLGSYTGALTICASILQTFPKFEQLRDVKLRFVLLQRYQLFSSSTDPAMKLAVLTKCIGFTQELLLDKVITEGPQHINVLYLHTRLNEMIGELSTPSSSNSPAQPKLAHVSVDLLLQELYKFAMKTADVVPPAGVKWKAWKSRSETYTAFAEYFRAQGENVLASDALSRSLEMLEALPLDSDGSQKAVDLWSLTDEQRSKRLALYLVLARNYYQCNQMEKAIRSMEAVIELDPLHTEARASLVEWFPQKWQYRLELEDASQVQIARVLRGIWGRKIALSHHREAKRLAEQRYRENPYHIGCRRHVLRWLRDKYAALFAGQDMAARRIQRRAQRYLYYARMRWKIEGQREKTVRDLKAKHQTRKYRYNLQVRSQLAALLPNEYERLFFRQDRAALGIQRCFRGAKTRKEFRHCRDAQRRELQRQRDAAQRIQRFYCQYCSPQVNSTAAIDDLLFRAQKQLARAKERLARKLQRLYRRWQSAKTRKHSALLYTFQAEATEQRRIAVENTSAIKIQRLWRRYTAGNTMDGRASQANLFFVENLRSAHRRQTSLPVDLSLAARKIQAAYRGKLMRRFLRMLRDRVPAPPFPSPIAALISKCEMNHKEGTETMAVLHSIDSLDEKRSLFGHPVLVFRGDRVLPRPNSPSTHESFSLQHVVSAIQYSPVLKSLICASGDFKGDRLLTILQALQMRRTLRVLALGEVTTIEKSSGNPDTTVDQWSANGEGETALSLGRRLLSLPSPPFSPQSHQKRQLSPMQLLAKALCTSNFLLEELYLESNDLLRKPQEGATVAGIVADYFFARYGHLHTLLIAHMRFSDANGALLGKALAINTVLLKLDLHGNSLCDGAAIAIANDGLAHNKTLRYLNLAENTIGSAGGRALFSCLGTSNRSLQTLILRNNHLMNDVIPVLIETWQVNAVIENVELAGNLINERFIVEFQSAASERREVTPAKENGELRLLLARKLFGIRDTRSPRSRRGIDSLSSPITSPGKTKDRKKQKKTAPLSPKKWISVNTPKMISPIAFPTSMNRLKNGNQKFAVENAYAPARPRKLLKGAPHSPLRLAKLPELAEPTRRNKIF
ncbi:MAP kinase kinase kinase activity protein [Phytophthora oleae]|uniref:MAP kinase kinase kinase activity protein n=1 Tax=Phytophthora oleae TaxID=2107226 RepID=A0ABD3EQR8_9STRA